MQVPTFDAARHAEISGLLGPELTLGAVRDLKGEIGRAFADAPGPGLSHAAHALSSQAEILGFLALGAACRKLEREIKVGTDIRESLADARARASEAARVVDAMLSS